jgi:hypothetical protein
MKIVGDVLIIETSDPDELRREVNRALGDEPFTVQGAAGYLKVSTRTIRNWHIVPAVLFSVDRELGR